MGEVGDDGHKGRSWIGKDCGDEWVVCIAFGMVWEGGSSRVVALYILWTLIVELSRIPWWACMKRSG